MRELGEEKRPKGLWAGILFICIELMMILVFVPNSWINSSRGTEANWMATLIGDEAALDVYFRADAWYDTIVVESGIGDGVHRFFIPTQEEQSRSKGFEALGDLWITFMENRSDALSSVVRVVLERVSHIWIWAPFMLVMAIPSIVDGYMSWKIKRTNFDYSSPFFNRYGHQLAWLCLMLVSVGLILPAPVPPVVIPVMCLAIIPIIGIWIIGNLPKRI